MFLAEESKDCFSRSLRALMDGLSYVYLWCQQFAGGFHLPSGHWKQLNFRLTQQDGYPSVRVYDKTSVLKLPKVRSQHTITSATPAPHAITPSRGRGRIGRDVAGLNAPARILQPVPLSFKWHFIISTGSRTTLTFPGLSTAQEKIKSNLISLLMKVNYVNKNQEMPLQNSVPWSL